MEFFWLLNVIRSENGFFEWIYLVSKIKKEIIGNK